MYAFAILIDQIINLYIWTLLAYLAAGWLIAFKIINPWQPIVRMIIDVLARIHEPLLRPVRRILPDFGATNCNFPFAGTRMGLFMGRYFSFNLAVKSAPTIEIRQDSVKMISQAGK